MNKKILVVDDEEDMRDLLSNFLKVNNYESECAKDGQEAFDMIKHSDTNGNSFGLIITDMKMPNLNGMELIEKLKGESIKIPVIAITGFHDRDLMLDIIKKGCEAYLVKPLRMENLLEHINAISSVMLQKKLVIVCSACKKTLGKEGLWKSPFPPESNTTHALCPECTKKMYPELCDRDQTSDDTTEHFFDFLP